MPVSGKEVLKELVTTQQHDKYSEKQSVLKSVMFTKKSILFCEAAFQTKLFRFKSDFLLIFRPAGWLQELLKIGWKLKSVKGSHHKLKKMVLLLLFQPMAIKTEVRVCCKK